MASVLVIAGSTVNREAAHIRLNRLTHSLDRPDELEFTEGEGIFPGTFAPEDTVTLTVDGTLEFAGWIFSRSYQGAGTGSIQIGYRCMSLRYGAYLIPVTASDGAGQMAFNLPVTDQDYSSTEAGLSIGTILGQVFAQHSGQLGAIGISQDGTTGTQLAALTVVSPDPVYVQGNNLWAQVEQVLQQWYGSKYALWITPSGKIRVSDTTALTAETLTFGTDPFVLDSLTEDTSECYTQVILRGRQDIEAAYVSLLEGTLIDPHTGADEAAWTLYDFLYPPNAFSTGIVNSNTSTTLTITSDDPLEHWGVNYWSGIQAEVDAIDTISVNIDGHNWRRIISNTALTAGGTSVLTVDRAMTSSTFDRYAIRGQPSATSGVYREYTLFNTYVAQHLQHRFNHSFPWSPSQGTLMQTLFPQAVICMTPAVGGASIVQWPLDFEIIPFDGTTDGRIRFYVPTVTVVPQNDQNALVTGGAAVTPPTDIIAMLPYSRGTLQAQAPSSGYAGTAYTRFNVQRTLYRDYPTWLDRADITSLTTLAGQILDTVSNVVQEGSVTYLGKYSTALVGGSWPISLSLAKDDATIGFESMAAPVRQMSIEWPQSGASPWVTRLSFSTRRQIYSGDRLYVHPMFAEGGFFGGMSQIMSPGAPVMGGEAQSAMAGAVDPRFSAQSAEAGSVAAQGAVGPADTMTQSPGFVNMPGQGQSLGPARLPFERTPSERLPAAERIGTGEGPARTPFERLPAPLRPGEDDNG